MDIYTLERDFRPKDAIDDSTSLIWTERYTSEGEVELILPDNPRNKGLIRVNDFLGINTSREAMHIQTVSSENGLITAKGKSLLSIFRERPLLDTLFPGPDSWRIEGPVGQLCANIVQQMCMVKGSANTPYVTYPAAGDNISSLVLGPIATGPTIVYSAAHGQVYPALEYLCQTFEMGQTLYPDLLDDDTYELIYTTYLGADRTSLQTLNDVVRFEPAMDNLTDTKTLTSIAAWKNVAYARPTFEAQNPWMGYAEAFPGAGNLRDFDRRVLLEIVSDLTNEDLASYTAAELKAILDSRARDALANHNYIRMSDGTIVPQGEYEYGTNYFLGDIVELGVPNAPASYARIVEYVQTKDETGFTAYPTLSVIE